MINYSSISSNFSSGHSDAISSLVSLWIEDYCSSVKNHELLEIPLGHCSYLYDDTAERLIAAWGISYGKSSEARDKSRMAGHPLSNGQNYHRGHAIPHTMGGGTDINLVPQLAKLNIGPFRVLEKKAVANPNSLYFTYWKYSNKQSQTPVEVDQGFALAGGKLEVSTFRN